MKVKQILSTMVVTGILWANSIVAFAGMPIGTVVAGNRAYSTEFMNSNTIIVKDVLKVLQQNEGIYVKDSSGWIKPSGSVVINTNIPQVTYFSRDSAPIVYAQHDGDILTGEEPAELPTDRGLDANYKPTEFNIDQSKTFTIEFTSEPDMYMLQGKVHLKRESDWRDESIFIDIGGKNKITVRSMDGLKAGERYTLFIEKGVAGVNGIATECTSARSYIVTTDDSGTVDPEPPVEENFEIISMEPIYD